VVVIDDTFGPLFCSITISRCSLLYNSRGLAVKSQPLTSVVLIEICQCGFLLPSSQQSDSTLQEAIIILSNWFLYFVIPKYIPHRIHINKQDIIPIYFGKSWE
jgi:hypothetical protein